MASDLGGKHVNAECLQAGLAGHSKRYDKDPILARRKHQASPQRRGFWGGRERPPAVAVAHATKLEPGIAVSYWVGAVGFSLLDGDR